MSSYKRSTRIGLVAILGFVMFAAVTFTPTPASARLIDFYVGGRAGAVGGIGTTEGTPDFFEHMRGPAAGVDLGLRLLLLDLSVGFLQAFDGSGRRGTLSQALLGLSVDIPLSPGAFLGGRSDVTVLRPSVAGGVAFGTLGPINPPLSADQISDKGFVGQVKLELEHFLNPFFAVGLAGIGAYHYFLGGTVVNAVKDHSAGYHGMLLGTLTFHLGI